MCSILVFQLLIRKVWSMFQCDHVLASSVYGNYVFGGDLDDFCWIVSCYSSTDKGNIWKRKFASLVTLALRPANAGLISTAIVCALCALVFSNFS